MFTIDDFNDTRPATGVKWIDVLDYYDGPLAGIVEWKGKRYHAEMIDIVDLSRWDKPTRVWFYAMVDLEGDPDPRKRPVVATFAE